MEKDNKREITYADLVGMGFYANGEMEEAGRIWASLIETEYRVINDYGTTLAWMDREAALQQSMDVLMLYTLVAMPLIDYIAYGPSMESLKGANFTDNAYDNLERYGTVNIHKGSNFSWNPPEGTNQDYYAAKSAGWKKQDGTTWWPNNDGFDDIPEKMTLQPGTRIDRYGPEKGIYTSPEGTPFDQRALAPGSENSPYNTYEAIKPFDVNAGKVASWFDQPGGGTQYQLPMSVEELIRQGYLR